MKIGIDARLWSESGVGRYIRNLVSGLDQIEAKKSKDTYVIFLRKKDFDSVHFKSDSFRKKLVDIQWHSLREQLNFTKIIEKENIELMHFPYFSIPLNYKKPFVITIHDLIIKKFPTGKASTLPTPIYFIKHAMYNKVLNHGVKNSQAILVPSHSVKQDIINNYDVPVEKITVTYEGVDEKISKLSVASSELHGNNLNDVSYFLYVGNAYPHKNVEFLINSFDHFIQHNPQYVATHLVLVGREDYFYKRIKEKLNTTSNVVFMHDVSDEALAEIYSNALAFVSASKSEGFGLPLLEAMKLGCPVICSDIPIFKEICNKAAIYFNNNKIVNLSEVFSSIMNMSARDKKTLISLGTKRAEYFSWDTMVNQTVEVYDGVIK